MSELQIGAIVHLTNGATATVKKLLGEGGQGYVYLALVNGKDMALKWYKNPPSSSPEKFYKNLRQNAESGAPAPMFIWPEYVTQHEQGSFGYVMKLRPEGYYEFGQFLINKQRFASLHAIFTSAIEICEAFKALHAKGLSYQDLNDGNFFIQPSTGHVMICDNDNAFPNGERSGILGKARYMAPEVVTGDRMPDAYTDKFSLAVILFYIIYMNHPFEGMKVLSHPCMTEELDRKCYGSEILFIADPNDKSNAPIKGLHNNVIIRWPLFPKLLRDTFTREFTAPILRSPNKRLTEMQWLDILIAVRDEVIRCPYCGKETFASLSKCTECGRTIQVNNVLSIEKRNLPLTDGNMLFIDRDDNPDMRVVHTAQDPTKLVVQNLMSEDIEVQTTTGQVRIVKSNEYFPVKAGLQLKLKIKGYQYIAKIQ